MCKTLRETSSFATFQCETTLNVSLLFSSLYSGPKTAHSPASLNVLLFPRYPATRLQKCVYSKVCFKADWKLHNVFILESAGPILRQHATSGIFTVQIPKYMHSPHTLGPVSNRIFFSLISKIKGHWED